MISSSDVAKGIHAKANVSCLLRADLKTQSEILATYVNNAILTPNEARGELDRVDNSAGDTLVCNGNYIPLDQVGNQYSTKGGES